MYTYASTKISCYIAFISQAVSFSIPPLFFAIFNISLGMSLDLIAFALMIGFIIQMTVDGLAVKYVDKIGYRFSMILGQSTCAVGLFLLGLLPVIMDNSFHGFFIAVVLYSIGGGITEVIANPIIQYLPMKNKAAEMSLLHSSYSWGSVTSILITSLLLFIIGGAHWYILPMIWSIIPFYNIYLSVRVPMVKPIPEKDRIRIRDFMKSPVFLVALLAMACAGASEHAVFQWSSFFAEVSLNLPKVMGDLIGPSLFAALGGIARSWFGKKGNQNILNKILILSALLCISCYLIIGLSPVPILAVIACGTCGFAVGLLWPGTLSLTARLFPSGGTAMFGLLAMGGALGISFGTWLTGTIGEIAGFRTAFLVATAFPIILLCCLIILNFTKTRKVLL